MDFFQMNRPCSRPYNATCGMAKEMMSDQQNTCRMESAKQSSCSCHRPDERSGVQNMYSHVDQMTPAMAYVPDQRFSTTYDLCYGLKVGTVFPEMCRPFCGKRGVQR